MTGQLPAPPDEPVRVSWSIIRAHGECKQRSHLIRTGHRTQAGDLRMFFGGMVNDRAMMDWLADPAHPAGQMARRIDELIDSMQHDAIFSGDGVVRWKGPGDREKVREFCVELANRLEPILRERVLPYPFEAAKRFKVPVTVPYLDGTPTTILLTGEMDLLVQDHGWVIWDLKGTKDNDYFRKVLGQLVFYDLATMCLHRAKTRKAGLIQPMCREPVREWVITDDARTTMWANILRYVEDVWRANNSCKDTAKGCERCEVNHACARFRPGNDAAGGLGIALRTAADTAAAEVPDA